MPGSHAGDVWGAWTPGFTLSHPHSLLQLIQTIRALDPDEDGATRVSIRAVPGPGPTDITVRDNKGEALPRPAPSCPCAMPHGPAC